MRILIEHLLFTYYGIPFLDKGKGKDEKIVKFIYLINANFTLFRYAKKLKSVLFLNFSHPYPSQVASLLNTPSLVFSDTEHASLHHRLTLPYATKVIKVER